MIRFSKRVQSNKIDAVRKFLLDSRIILYTFRLVGCSQMNLTLVTRTQFEAHPEDFRKSSGNLPDIGAILIFWGGRLDVITRKLNGVGHSRFVRALNRLGALQ